MQSLFDLSPLQSARKMLNFQEAHMKGYFGLGSYQKPAVLSFIVL